MDTAKDWAPTFRKKTTKKKIKVAIWSPHLCPGTGKTKVENTDCNKLEDLEKVVGKWHGIQVRSLGLGRHGRCIERASAGPST